MKKLAWIIVILLLAVIVFFQFMKYQRFHPGTDYNYAISSEIDANYHDPTLVLEYYETAHKAGNFARSMWSSESIDVRFPESGDIEEESAARTYGQILASAQYLEEKLKRSLALKSEGFSNSDIQLIETTGIAPQNISYQNQLAGSIFIKGQQSPQVYLLQNLLKDHGFELPVDGNFADQTEAAVKEFQTRNNLSPSGIADPITIDLLLKPTQTQE